MSRSNLAFSSQLAVTLTSVTDDDRSPIENHLLAGMEAELASTREELMKAAARASRVDNELLAVAQRLTAKETEHEAALKALAKMRDELFDARTALEESETKAVDLQVRLTAEENKPAPAPVPRSFAERAVGKVVRMVKP